MEEEQISRAELRFLKAGKGHQKLTASLGAIFTLLKNQREDIKVLRSEHDTKLHAATHSQATNW